MKYNFLRFTAWRHVTLGKLVPTVSLGNFSEPFKATLSEKNFEGKIEKFCEGITC